MPVELRVLGVARSLLTGALRHVDDLYVTRYLRHSVHTDATDPAIRARLETTSAQIASGAIEERLIASKEARGRFEQGLGYS